MALHHKIHQKLKHHWYEHFPLYIFFLFFLPFYFIKLDILPFAFHGDEANTALGALDILQKHTIIGVGWYDLPLLSFFPHLVTMLIFGKSVIGDRLGSVFFGVTALPFFYALTKSWYGRRVGIFATILFGTCHMWIALSRIGIAYVQSGWVLIITLFFLWKAYQTQKVFYAIVAGFSLGFSLYFYYAARIIPIILLPGILGVYIVTRQKRQFLFLGLITLVAFLSLTLPQILFFSQHPTAFGSRTSEVFIFSSDKSIKDWLSSTYKGEGKVQVLISQTIKAFSLQKGDTGGQYGYKGMLLDWLSIILLFLGIWYGYKVNRNIFVFCIYWLAITFIGGVILTVDPIFVPRFVVGLPVLYLFIALGIESVFLSVKKYPHWQITITGAILTIIVFWNLYIYFVVYPVQLLEGVAGDRNAFYATEIAYFLQKQPKQTTAIFLTPPNLYGDFAPLQFIAPSIAKISIDNPSEYLAPKPCPSHVIYIMYAEDNRLLAPLQYSCPHGKEIPFVDSNNQIRFYAYQL